MARHPAPIITRICEVERVRDRDGRPLHLTVYGLGRKTRFARPHQVPTFEGDLAWFEVTSKAKTPLGVVFLRQVEKPALKTHWSR